MDFVLSVDRLPMPGETILGRDFRTVPGGKGGNQAYAAAKLAREGIAVRMIGRVGADSFGCSLKANLTGVDVSTVLETESVATGVACIHVDKAGQEFDSLSRPGRMRGSRRLTSRRIGARSRVRGAFCRSSRFRWRQWRRR